MEPEGLYSFKESKFSSFANIQNSSTKNTLAEGPRKGKQIRKLTEKTGGNRLLFEEDFLCYTEGGYSLHAERYIEEVNRGGLEKLVKYVLRPQVSNERITILDGDKVCYQLKNRFQDGTSHFIYSAEEFIERIIALIPYPYQNFIRYTGVLAPNHDWRAEVIGVAPNQKIEMKLTLTQRISWSELMKRSFSLDVLQCQCGGRLRLVKVVERKEAEKFIFLGQGPPNPIFCDQNEVIYEDVEDVI